MKVNIVRCMVLNVLLIPMFGVTQNLPTLEIHELTPDFFIYKTFHEYKGSRISANGMYVVTDAGAVLFDTPWDTTQFQPLLDSIKQRHNKEVVLCMATHFHEDRTAGLEYYRKQGIKTLTTRKTDELSKMKGMKRATFLMNNDSVIHVGQYKFRAYYPGPGHTPDNIIIWFEKERILYGGCLIKSYQDSSLGNLSDADIKQYPATLETVKKICKKPKYVIPGHNEWTNTKSLGHTLRMAREKQKVK